MAADGVGGRLPALQHQHTPSHFAVVRPPPPTLHPAPRPAVLDAARTALIPLRPLTIGEILDGAFLVVRRNVRLMVGLPLVVAGGTAVYVLAGVGVWILLGNSTSEFAQTAVTIILGLVGFFLLVQCVVWMAAILSRVSLQTVLGEGFAPSTGALTLRRSLSLFWPMFGLSLLQYLAASVIQTAMSILYYLVLAGSLLTGGDPAVSVALGVIVTIVVFALTMLAYGYISLTVPAFATEGAKAPGWIGKPYKPTSVFGAFERSLKLVGRKHMLRVTLIFSGAVLVSGGLVLLVAVGGLSMLALFASAINEDVANLLSNPWTIFGVSAFAVIVAMSGVLAYLAAVQTLLYLDLRMRREGLDMALRFDCVPIPQPAAPPVTFSPPLLVPPPIASPRPWTP